MKTISDVINRRIDQAMEVMVTKENEYAKESKRYHNFLEAAEYLDCTPIESAIYFMTKHIVSIADIVDDKNLRSDLALKDEKFGDAFNYCVLILGMIQMTDQVGKLYRQIEKEMSDILAWDIYTIDTQVSKVLYDMPVNKQRLRSIKGLIEANDYTGVRRTIEDLLQSLLIQELLTYEEK